MKLGGWLLLSVIIFSAASVFADHPARLTKRVYVSLPSTGKEESLPINDVLVGNTLYLAGRIGRDPATQKVPGEIEQEINFLFESVKLGLAKQGMDMANIVLVQIYCTDLSLYSQFNTRYKKLFVTHFPARAFVGVNALALNAHFEMLVIAVK